MTSGESFDSNAGAQDGISIEITNITPRFFPTPVYAIPKNELGAKITVKLTVSINLTTSTPFWLNPYQSFIPELWTPDGQKRQILLVPDEPAASTEANRLLTDSAASPLTGSETRNFKRWRIQPGILIPLGIRATLSWHQDSLQLKIPTISDFFLSGALPKNFWCFDALQEGTYQIRFLLNFHRHPEPLELDTGEVGDSEESDLEVLATPFANIRLVMPGLTDSSAIEVDGVQFKTEMPEPVLAVSPKRYDVSTPVKLGIRATNNTSTALRFEQLDSLDVSLIDEAGNKVHMRSDLLRTGVGSGPKYYSAQPGESALFVLDGQIDWVFNQLQLAIPNQAGGFFYFYPLQPGRYQIQLIYRATGRHVTGPKEQILEKVWTGWVFLPFVEFYLV
ncbi:MAG: hypothetical protein KME26_02175 [Oscillatoria princeps RMCB-10]|jgi:hypothetical protein|nr:hypothetical protein [Oscillatoria princeps RMCB-10]